MAVSTAEEDNEVSEINITPLVDVMLVLLVAFVITIPALTNAIHVNLPRTVTTSPPEQQKAITVTVDNAGWNATLDAGASTTFGFTALTGDGDSTERPAVTCRTV